MVRNMYFKLKDPSGTVINICWEKGHLNHRDARDASFSK